MDIEKEIGQSVKFDSERHKLAVNILYTASWLHVINTAKMKQFNLTPQQFNILRILRGQHPKAASVNLLVQRMLDKSSNASRLVDRLEEKGYVKKAVNNKDKRAVDVIITEAGLAILRCIDEDPSIISGHMSTLSEKEADLLNQLLDKLRG